MGKTEKGALWLSAEKLTPFEFFQYLRNIDDEDIEKVYKMVSVTDIEKIEKDLNEEKNPNVLKEKLAYDITKRVHGKEEADKALNTAKEIFSGKINTEALPIIKVSLGENMLDVCIKAGFGKSRGEIKKLIASNSINLGEKAVEVGRLVEEKDLDEGNNILKKGKKVVVKLEKE
jgi:tyrosine--tRNA ligase